MYKYITNPKIIVVVRDGRDVVASLKERHGDINIGIKRWIDDNNQWMNHEKRDEFYIMKYENFISNPKLEIKKVMDFIGEEYYDEILNYKQTKINLPVDFYDGLIVDEKHRLLRNHQINKKIYDGSKRYLTDLDSDELELLYLNSEFVKIMKEMNYM